MNNNVDNSFKDYVDNLNTSEPESICHICCGGFDHECNRCNWPITEQKCKENNGLCQNCRDFYDKRK